MVESYSKNANHNMRRPVVKDYSCKLYNQRKSLKLGQQLDFQLS